jgi:hypothetical protein
MGPEPNAAVLGAIVHPAADLLAIDGADLFQGGTMNATCP